MEYNRAWQEYPEDLRRWKEQRFKLKLKNFFPTWGQSWAKAVWMGANTGSGKSDFASAMMWSEILTREPAHRIIEREIEEGWKKLEEKIMIQTDEKTYKNIVERVNAGVQSLFKTGVWVMDGYWSVENRIIKRLIKGRLNHEHHGVKFEESESKIILSHLKPVGLTFQAFAGVSFSTEASRATGRTTRIIDSEVNNLLSRGKATILNHFIVNPPNNYDIDTAIIVWERLKRECPELSLVRKGNVIEVQKKPSLADWVREMEGELKKRPYFTDPYKKPEPIHYWNSPAESLHGFVIDDDHKYLQAYKDLIPALQQVVKEMTSGSTQAPNNDKASPDPRASLVAEKVAKPFNCGSQYCPLCNP